MPLAPFYKTKDNIVHCHNLGLTEFEKEFDKQFKPVVISGIVDDWPAHDQWKKDSLLKKFGHLRLAVGEDSAGYAIDMSLKNYIKYMDTNNDDEPLYIYEDQPPQELLQGYLIPKYWREGTIHLDPPYRWFLLGGPRTGTALHVDPHNTAAWNALVWGRKRWLLFPPTQSSGISSRDTLESLGFFPKYANESEEEGALSWIINHYSKLNEKNVEFFETIQNPAEVIFVPSLWYHLVLNLESSVSVTENFVNETNKTIVQHSVHSQSHLSSNKDLYF